MRKDFYFVALFLLAIWLVYIVDAIVPFSLADWGVHPRRLRGLIGIPLMPMLHSSLGHLFGNTISLAVLLFLLVGSRTHHWPIVVTIVIGNGVLLWLFGRSANHIGASGLVFGLIAFLIVAGILEKKLVPLAIAILVGVLFGGTLISGVLPRIGSEVSWDGHLMGAIAGSVVAYTMTRSKSRDV